MATTIRTGIALDLLARPNMIESATIDPDHPRMPISAAPWPGRSRPGWQSLDRRAIAVFSLGAITARYFIVAANLDDRRVACPTGSTARTPGTVQPGNAEDLAGRVTMHGAIGFVGLLSTPEAIGSIPRRRGQPRVPTARSARFASCLSVLRFPPSAARSRENDRPAALSDRARRPKDPGPVRQGLQAHGLSRGDRPRLRRD